MQSPKVWGGGMERGEGFEVGGIRMEISWWLDREIYSSQPRPGSGKVVSQNPVRQQQVQGEPTGPVEKLHQVSLSQGWGIPRYSCNSFLDYTGQQVFQYSVSVPAVPTSSIMGEASLDRHIAMMNSAW